MALDRIQGVQSITDVLAEAKRGWAIRHRVSRPWSAQQPGTQNPDLKTSRTVVTFHLQFSVNQVLLISKYGNTPLKTYIPSFPLE